MPDWPHTIPYDLRETLEAADHEAWRPAFQSWAKSHGLRFKLHWEADLMRRVGELDQWRWTPGIQDRWAAIREWLVAHDVPVSDRLPMRPETNSRR
ncbi:hypothetical protein EBB79_11945 [Parasedimentitalea marina]|uniref:Uncharacterized protein n=1 Tax=Parasedimentitalea marina TaxID=2483033 RepID=A0A3T0N3B5_9RHOB|nr:hypothetical protein [Parasedimentitalea marina]AZV78518.1 hypothetical protein EBB79_11945 [Parasedimentitalea marina]